MVTFVATAYNETVDAYQFISCLLLQTNSDWKCIIYSDAPNQYIKNAVEFFNDSRISYYENETPTKFWGHYNRKTALDMVNTEFIIQTSIQDYYLPITVELINSFGKDYDFIYYDCIHNHVQHRILETELKASRIDWGCFAIKTEIAKQVGYNHLDHSHCDGIFVEECFIKFPNIKEIKLNRLLTTHN